MERINFREEVIEKSFEKPILVDFWAPWCGPCRVLGPVLEQLDKENDHWSLVKINTEEEVEIAQAYQIMSIPNVKLFHQGQVIAEFAGALPRATIENWLAEHLPDERKALLGDILQQLQNGNQTEAALDALEQFTVQHPDVIEARIALANKVLIANPDKAKALIEDIHMGDKFYDEAEDLRLLVKFLLFQNDGSPVGGLLDEGRQAIIQGDLEMGIQKIIEATSTDRSFQNDLPRKVGIAFFRTLGNQHELTKNYRWKFDMALY